MTLGEGGASHKVEVTLGPYATNHKVSARKFRLNALYLRTGLRSLQGMPRWQPVEA
jgi:hypothetical protein